jgi:hypothetical protein
MIPKTNALGNATECTNTGGRPGLLTLNGARLSTWSSVVNPEAICRLGSKLYCDGLAGFEFCQQEL